MVDLVTRLQLKDAVKNHRLIADRVKHVALHLMDLRAKYNSDIDGVPWAVDSYRIDASPIRPEREHEADISISVKLSTAWHNRPKTEKFGDPNEDSDDVYFKSDFLCRFVQFPLEYLTTDAWEDHAEQKAKERARLQALVDIDGLQEAIQKAETKLDELRAKLVETKDKAHSKT